MVPWVRCVRGAGFDHPVRIPVLPRGRHSGSGFVRDETGVVPDCAACRRAGHGWSPTKGGTMTALQSPCETVLRGVERLPGPRNDSWPPLHTTAIHEVIEHLIARNQRLEQAIREI